MNSSKLSDDDKRKLKQLLTTISKETTIILKGYTDPTGTEEHNIRLAYQRATVVKDFLIEHGINNSQITIEEYRIGNNASNRENRTCILLAL